MKIWSNKIIDHKIDYINKNSVEEGCVEKPYF